MKAQESENKQLILTKSMKNILYKKCLLVQCKIYQKISIGGSDSIKTIKKKINKTDYFSIKWQSSFIKALLGKVVNFN